MVVSPAGFYHLLYENTAFEQTASAFAAGKSVSIDGVIGSAGALTIAALTSVTGQKPILVIVAGNVQAENAAEDIAMFADWSERTVSVFPALDKDIDESVDDTPFAFSDENFGGRINVLKLLNGKHTPQSHKQHIIVTTMPALLQEVPPQALLTEKTQRFSAGQRIDLENLRHYLVDNGYHSMSAADCPGEFAIRGYILDIFAPDWHQPVRIELFDDEIESVRRFDSVTQRSLENINEIDLTSILPSEATGASLLDYFPNDSPIILVEERQFS
ncbi:MAG: hypothetical protein LBT46_01940 [Planctomycetaceae bacterium]|jgi:transcription-repair coupling factor (superfamily II helicase)|nr:hypothetical protein [Planctomycetaceae bacterium]